MNCKIFLRRLTAALVALMLLMASAQAESYAAIVTAKSAKLYADEACTWNIDSLPMATVITVQSIKNGVASIEFGDREGYVSEKDVKSIKSLAKPAAVNRDTYAYRSASTSSKSVKVKKGVELNLLATNGDWVMVERSGTIAYMKKSHVTLKSAAEKEETPKEETSKEETIVETAQAVINSNTYVYQKASTSSKKLKVKKGMEVTLLTIDGKWAKVRNGSAVAYIKKEYLDVIEPEEDPETQPDEKDENGTILIETFSAKVVTDSMRVYEKADKKSACLGSVKKGTVVTVHAYNSNGWAYIELNSNKGYAEIADMERVNTSIPETEPTPEPSAKDYLNDESISVEKRVYMFLTREMGLNTAAACGILANIEKESSFRVTAGSFDGGYGLVQWTGGRNTKLQNWCAEKGYDHATLEGQLWFLKYELEGSYKKTLNYLKEVANAPEGAYEAGYYFCYNFEVPANRETRSVQRGNLAKDSYWQKYAA